MPLSSRVLWAAQGIRRRITTASELRSFFLANRSTPFLIYDSTRSNVYLAAVGIGTGAGTLSLDHTYVTSGMLSGGFSFWNILGEHRSDEREPNVHPLSPHDC